MQSILCDAYVRQCGQAIGKKLHLSSKYVNLSFYTPENVFFCPENGFVCSFFIWGFELKKEIGSLLSFVNLEENWLI